MCLSVCPSPHSYTTIRSTDSDVTSDAGRGVPSSCALLGRFAIGAGFRCHDNIAPNAKCERMLVLALCLVVGAVILYTRLQCTAIAPLHDALCQQLSPAAACKAVVQC